MNNGACLIQGGEVEKISFPFINEDYFIGKFMTKNKEYKVKIIRGLYYEI